MQNSGVTQYDGNQAGGAGIKGARNGLNIVTVGTDRYIELGGVLIHDTEISSIVGQLYKFGLLNTSFYINGSLGNNPITGAGTRLGYIPSKRVLYFGSATGTEFDFANASVLNLQVIGNLVDFGNAPSGFALVIGTLASGQINNSFAIVSFSSGTNVQASIAELSNSNNAQITGCIINANDVPASNLLNVLGVVSGLIGFTASNSIVYVQNSKTGGNISVITDSYYHNFSTSVKGSINIFDSFVHGKFAQQMTTNGCFYFLPTYSGPNLNETNIVRFQTQNFAPGLKVDIADPKMGIGIETLVGVLNLAAGTAIKPLMQLQVGITTPPGSNQVQYNGIAFVWMDNLGSTYTLRKARTVISVTEPLIFGANYLAGTIFHCTTTRNITLSTAAFFSSTLVNDTIRFKDGAGTAGASPITINPPGGKFINGATSYVINTNYGSVEIYYDGTNFFTI